MGFAVAPPIDFTRSSISIEIDPINAGAVSCAASGGAWPRPCCPARRTPSKDGTEMKCISSGFVFVGLSVGVLAAAQAPKASQAPAVEAAADVRGGSVTFDVGTNVFAINVRGASGALNGRARMHQNGEALRLEDIEAAVAVESLRTGLKLRDGHMRKYIFQTPDGKEPDLRLSAKSAECSPADASRAVTCVASGELAIRGTAKPFSIPLKVVKTGDEFRVSGDGALVLSTYGIERPSQFGVKTNDEVKLHLEFSVKSGPPVSASAAVPR
jgi:polyisoprenoid-binding protein YceI